MRRNQAMGFEGEALAIIRRLICLENLRLRTIIEPTNYPEIPGS